MGADNKRISKELEKEMIKLYLSGKTLKEIENITGKDYTTVSKVLKRNNIESRYNPTVFSFEEEKEIIKLYEEGNSILFISSYLGTYRPNIRKVLNKYNVKFRERGFYSKVYEVNDRFFEFPLTQAVSE